MVNYGRGKQHCGESRWNFQYLSRKPGISHCYKLCVPISLKSWFVSVSIVVTCFKTHLGKIALWVESFRCRSTLLLAVEHGRILYLKLTHITGTYCRTFKKNFCCVTETRWGRQAGSGEVMNRVSCVWLETTTRTRSARYPERSKGKLSVAKLLRTYALSTVYMYSKITVVQ